MDVDGDGVRVANIVYGSHVTEVFDLNDFTTATQIRDALLDTIKLGGGTLTGDALTLAAMTLFDDSRGSREGVKKVAILITDGKSLDANDTVSSAVTLKNKGTTMFAIGVGYYLLSELERVASTPICSHVFTLTDFTSILSILTQIQISTCDAGLVLIPGEEVKGKIPEAPVEVVTQTLNPGPNSTITVTAICGQLDIYLSYSERNPSSVVHEEYYHATSGSPANVTTKDSLGQGSPVYITLVVSRLSLAGCQRYEWSIGVDEPSIKIRLVGGGRGTEGRVEVFTNGYWGTVCDDHFGHYDAIVACRMMGYESVVPEVHSGSYYGSGQGTIWLDEVDCSGAEASLFDCRQLSGVLHDCKHTEDVGVDCAPSNASPELTSGASIISDGSSTTLVAGVVGGAVGLALLAVAATLLRKYLTGRNAVEAIIPEGDSSTYRRESRGSPNLSSVDSFPIPALEPSVPSMRMPADTRLSPLVSHNPLFPPLRS
ncbi:hypothetical protein ACOMHN_056481 [Nucella lapillus]